MQDELFDMLMKEDDISWQSILQELVKSEKMDPWDINVTQLTRKYLDVVKKLQEFDFKISGKVVLCAALLLKMKSKRLLGADLERFDALFADAEEYDDDLLGFEDDPYAYARRVVKDGAISLIPRSPQPRKRKVSIYDLMEALQKAMEVKKRRVMRNVPENLDFTVPKKKMDISVVIREVYGRIKSWFHGNKARMSFTQLVPGQTKEDKVYTFIPLLHLTNDRKIDLFQEQHFGEIEIELLRKKVEKEINAESSSEAEA